MKRFKRETLLKALLSLFAVVQMYHALIYELGHMMWAAWGLTPELKDKVTFHGYVSRPDLVRLYYDADIFVFPPVWNEAFGVTPLDAMAAGVPVAVSRCGGIVETVAPALAQAMLRLLEDDTLRERMGRASMQRALQFNWDIVTGGMLARYQALSQVGSQARGSVRKNLVTAG